MRPRLPLSARALGAASGNVISLVVRQGVVLGIVGVLAGIAGSAALRRAIESKLFGVDAFDPATLLLAGMATITLCVIASLVPAPGPSRP